MIPEEPLQMTTDIEIQLDSIEDAIEDIKKGKVVIVVDDEDRENEGDFICAADHITSEIINFMATHGRGLICTPITQTKADELKLAPMVNQNTDLHGTAFTVSIDYKKEGCTTGISAYDRSTGIKAMMNASTKPEDFARPGHIFPLIAKDGGVLKRTGHTEAAIDLAKLAGLNPGGVLVEILNEDGTMARLPQLYKFAKRFDLKLISIEDLVAYRMKQERLVNEVYRSNVDTAHGSFELIAFKEKANNATHIALRKGTWEPNEAVLTRVYATTNSSMILNALLRENEPTIMKAMQRIESEGKGLILMIRQPEDHDEIVTHLKYILEQSDEAAEIKRATANNNRHRNIGIGAQILKDIGLNKIRIMTNNPKPIVALNGYGLEVVDFVPF